MITLYFTFLITIKLVNVTDAKIDDQLPYFGSSPIIYDNDDHRDVYTDEYLLALSSIGEIDLRGLITTYIHHEYPDFVAGRREIIEVAQESKLKNIPKLFSGTNRKLSRPENNIIEDTKPLEINGSWSIVEAARNASKAKPLVIISGGQLTSIANSYLLDSSIAEKIVVMGVFGAEKIDYNASLDSWAWTIILNKFRVVSIPFGSPGNRGKVFMKPPQVPKDRIKIELNQSIPFFKWMLQKSHPSNSLPNGADYDGHPAILLTKPEYVTEWNRFECIGINEQGLPILEQSNNGKIWQAVDAQQQIATDEFWRVMKLLNKQLQ